MRRQVSSNPSSARSPRSGQRLFLAPLIICLWMGEPALARTWHVPGDAPTIQAGINLAQAGDDVLVGPGQYHEYDIALKADVVVHSESGASVTFVRPDGRGNGFVCDNLTEQATIDGFTIVGGSMSSYPHTGGGVSAYNSHLRVCNCIIRECTGSSGAGIYSWGSRNLDVERCRVSGCTGTLGGGGILAKGGGFRVHIVDSEVVGNTSPAWGAGIVVNNGEATIRRSTVSWNVSGLNSGGGVLISHSPMFTIEDCVIVQNRVNGSYLGLGGGVRVESSDGQIAGCTMAFNTGSPEPNAIASMQSSVQVERTVVAFNEGKAINCVSGGTISVQCCNFFGNSGGNGIGCGTDLGNNFRLDPAFCEAASGNYTLFDYSPCLPGHHPDGADCGLVGALGEGCGATSIEPMSWGAIKGLFR